MYLKLSLAETIQFFKDSLQSAVHSLINYPTRLFVFLKGKILGLITI